MGGHCLQRSGLIAPGDGLEGVSRVGVATLDRGDCLILWPSAGIYSGDAVGYPAGSPVDGPFLRLTPKVTGVNDQGLLGVDKRLRGQRARNGDTMSFTGGGGAATLTVSSQPELYYEIDANCNLPVYAPVDCSAELVTSVGGAWIYSSFLFKPGDNPTKQGMAAPLYRQTRDVQAGQTRTLLVPFGAVAWEVICETPAANPPAINIQPDNQGARALTNQNIFGAGANPLMGQRMSLANARALIVTAGAANRVKIIFYIQLV